MQFINLKVSTFKKNKISNPFATSNSSISNDLCVDRFIINQLGEKLSEYFSEPAMFWLTFSGLFTGNTAVLAITYDTPLQMPKNFVLLHELRNVILLCNCN